MELDKRIMSGKKPLTCFDIDEAEKYVGQKCYISNEYDFYRNLDFTQQKILNGVEDCEEPFHYDQLKQAKFCLPCEWVKEPEKKYRAFTIKEFQQKYSVGSVLKIRQKQNRFAESVVQYVGYKVYEERIYLGITDFTLDELFENFEMIEPQSDTWHPFGVIDEDKE